MVIIWSLKYVWLTFKKAVPIAKKKKKKKKKKKNKKKKKLL
jgi:hypothetical protein